ncbi:MAG: glycosyltransferase family 2 protein [candidate division WOR-3 bacterium]|nr:glycosyltransferase family 2 protein [candidate division WOR-3 bacterium]
MDKLSVIVPVYNEAPNLPVLYERLRQAIRATGMDWEWVAVDDHSSDDGFAVLSAIAKTDPHVRAIRLARNHGSHGAIACGLHNARGDCAVVLAADLQDPPETISALLDEWHKGSQVVWAVRGKREGEKASTLLLARVFYFLIRHLVGIRDMASAGADFVLIDRRVIDTFCRFQETNISIMVLLTWMGFRQGSITYTKQARQHGVSGWNLEKKLKLAVDSITSFSYRPIRIISYAGFCFALLGFLYALLIIVYAILRRPVQGWSSLMVAVLVIGGVQMLMMGILGEYLWRAFDESRRRPLFLIEETTEKDNESKRPSEGDRSRDKP